MESRTQRLRPRPRTQKKTEAKAKDRLFEDRPSEIHNIFKRTDPLKFTKFTISLSTQVFKILHFVKFFMANFPQGFRRSQNKTKKVMTIAHRLKTLD